MDFRLVEDGELNLLSVSVTMLPTVRSSCVPDTKSRPVAAICVNMFLSKSMRGVLARFQLAATTGCEREQRAETHSPDWFFARARAIGSGHFCVPSISSIRLRSALCGKRARNVAPAR